MTIMPNLSQLTGTSAPHTMQLTKQTSEKQPSLPQTLFAKIYKYVCQAVYCFKATPNLLTCHESIKTHYPNPHLLILPRRVMFPQAIQAFYFLFLTRQKQLSDKSPDSLESLTAARFRSPIPSYYVLGSLVG